MDVPRNHDQIGLDVENPNRPDSKDSGRLNGPRITAPKAQVAHHGAVHMIPSSFATPGTIITEIDPIFGDQVFNIQWVLMIFWPLLFPVIVGVFLPLCNRPERRFPSLSYKRGWIGNLVMSGVMTIYWLILIIVCAVLASRSASSSSPAPAPAPAPAPQTGGGAMG